jgi:hypothetical protein
VLGLLTFMAAASRAARPPATPEGFTAVALNESSISLAWLDPTGWGIGFEIQRRSSGGSEDAWVAIAASVPPGVESHVDTGLPDNRAFDFRIKALGTSKDSDWVSTAGATPPAAPSQFEASFLPDGRVRLAWIENSSTADHRIERRSDQLSDDWRIIGNTPAGTGAAGWSDPDIVIDAHDPTEYAYRVSAVSGLGQSAAIERWAPSCPVAPAFPEQAWLDDLRLRIAPAPWSGDPASLPPRSETPSARGWNRDGTTCEPDATGHYPCDYVMIGNDRYLALFVGGGLSGIGAGNARVNAGGLVGLTQRQYGMEFIRWDGNANQHIWNLAVNPESDLSAASETFYPSGFQQGELHSITMESVGGGNALVFEWRLAGGGEGQIVKTFWTLASRGLTGLHGRIEVTGTRSDGQGISSVQFPVVGSLGYYGPDGVDLVVPSEGLGMRIHEFSRALSREYLSSSLSAQFISVGKDPFALYVASEDGQSETDPAVYPKTIRFQNTAISAGLSVHHYPADGAGVAGNHLTHGSVVLAPLCGDWRRVAKRYRRFALQQSWLSAPIDARSDIPESVKRGLFLWAENHGSKDSEFYRRSALYLKQLLLDGHQNRIDGSPPPLPPEFTAPPFPNGPPLAFHLLNWHTPIFDTGAPTFDSKPGIDVAIASMEADGSSVAIPYINATDADITLPALPGADPDFWQPFIKKTAGGEYWTTQLATGASYGSIALNTTQWRSTFGELVATAFGLAKGVYLDTYGGENRPDYADDLSLRDLGTQFKGYGPWIVSSSQQLGDLAKAQAALDAERFVTAEHFSEVYIDRVDLVLLYRSIGNLLDNNSSSPTEEFSEIVGLIPAVYSDYQAFAGYPSSAHDNPRAAAMKHAIGFVLGSHVGLMGRSSIGVKGNLDFTICDASYTGPRSHAWMIDQAAGCEARLAYLTTLAHARFYLERYFRGEYLGPAEDRSPDQMLTEYWCRSSSCAPPGLPATDICTDGDQPDDPSCASRFRKVVLPAIRGGTWISPDGDRAIVLTNTDAFERVVDVPVPRSWDAASDTAELCRADVPDPRVTGECSNILVADGLANGVSLPAYSARVLYFAASDGVPAVTISLPSNWSEFPSGSIVTLLGSAIDAEDGDLSESLQWTSNLSGVLGSGRSLGVALPDGSHVITASASDWRGNTGTDAVNALLKPALAEITLAIASQTVTRENLGSRKAKGSFTVRIEDADGNAVPGVSVRADYSGPTSGSVTAPNLTDASGDVALLSKKASRNLEIPWCFRVTDLSAPGALWDGVALEVCEF